LEVSSENKIKGEIAKARAFKFKEDEVHP